MDGITQNPDLSKVPPVSTQIKLNKQINENINKYQKGAINVRLPLGAIKKMDGAVGSPKGATRDEIVEKALKQYLGA